MPGRKKYAGIVLIHLPQNTRRGASKRTKFTTWRHWEHSLGDVNIHFQAALTKAAGINMHEGWRRLKPGRVRTPGFSQRGRGVRCMLIKHSSAGWLKVVSDDCGVAFFIYASPRAGGCLVSVTAAARCNCTKMVSVGYFCCIAHFKCFRHQDSQLMN